MAWFNRSYVYHDKCLELEPGRAGDARDSGGAEGTRETEEAEVGRETEEAKGVVKKGEENERLWV